MFNKISWNTFFVCLTATLIASTATTFAKTEVIVEGTVYDHHHHVKITNAYNKVTSPTFWSDHWEVRTTLHFENSLYAVSNSSWKHETEALRAVEMASLETFPKKVVIIRSEQNNKFIVLGERDECFYSAVDLWIDRDHSFHQLPYIVAIIETEEEIHHWLSADQHKYRYTIELSDGTLWLKEGTEKWKHNWMEGSEIIRVGTGLKPILINKSRVLSKEHHQVEKDDFLDKVQQLR